MITRVNLGRYPDYMKWIASKPVKKGVVLLYGSSLFTKWGYDRANEVLSVPGKYEVINHGFGGSVAEDLVYNYNFLVKPYEPKAVLIRTAVNDAYYGYSMEESFFLTKLLCSWIKNDFPECKIAIMEVPECPAKDLVRFRSDFKKYDSLIREWAADKEDISTINISHLMYNNEKDVGTYENFRNIFVPDGLHYTDEGYDFLAPFFKNKIEEMMK